MTFDLLPAVKTLMVGEGADLWWRLLIVFALGAVPTVEVLFAIPAGAVLGLSPIVAGLTATIGNLLSLLVLAALEVRFRTWFVRHFNLNHGNPGQPSARRQWFQRIWNRYGVPGVALAAPLTVGSHMTLLLALLVGGERARVLTWLVGGLLGWGLIITALLALGIETSHRFFALGVSL